MQAPSQLPSEFDAQRPCATRVYDFLLGGGANLAGDRELARTMLAIAPDMRLHALANHACRQRVVRACLDAGIRQFLDIGCGVGTVGAPHQVAARHPAGRQARVAYVAGNPVTAAQGELLLAGTPGTTVVRTDPRDMHAALYAERTRALLNFDQPVAVLMFALLHRSPVNPAEALRHYTDAVPTGSVLALTRLTGAHSPHARALAELGIQPELLHDDTALKSIEDSWEILEPGVVPTTEWRPERGDADLRGAAPLSYVVVARKP